VGRRASPAVIGAFVLGAMALAVIGITIFGSGKLFRKTSTFAPDASHRHSSCAFFSRNSTTARFTRSRHPASVAWGCQKTLRSSFTSAKTGPSMPMRTSARSEVLGMWVHAANGGPSYPASAVELAPVPTRSERHQRRRRMRPSHRLGQAFRRLLTRHRRPDGNRRREKLANFLGNRSASLPISRSTVQRRAARRIPTRRIREAFRPGMRSRRRSALLLDHSIPISASANSSCSFACSRSLSGNCV